MIKLMFVCHGNICRSTMAEYIMKHLVAEKGLASQFYITSSATSTEEIGNGVHYGTRSVLAANGIRCGNHKAVQLKASDYERYDYIIGMDTANLNNMRRILKHTDDKICLLLSFCGESGSIADPWYTGNFEQTFADVTKGCNALLKHLLTQKKVLL